MSSNLTTACNQELQEPMFVRYPLLKTVTCGSSVGIFVSLIFILSNSIVVLIKAFWWPFLRIFGGPFSYILKNGLNWTPKKP